MTTIALIIGFAFLAVGMYTVFWHMGYGK